MSFYFFPFSGGGDRWQRSGIAGPQHPMELDGLMLSPPVFARWLVSPRGCH